MADVLDALSGDESSEIDASVDEVTAELVKNEPTEGPELARNPDTGQFVAQETESEPEAKAPDEDAAPEAEKPEASGEEEQDDEPEAEPEEAIGEVIDAPASWTDDERAAYAQLPPEVQTTIASRESERERTLNSRAANSARESKTTLAERESLQTERQNNASFLAYVSNYAQQMDPIIAKGLNTDWAALARDEGFEEAQTQQLEFNQRVQLLQKIDAESQRQAKEYTDGKRDSETQLLHEKMPHFADPVKAGEAKESYLPTLYDAGYTTEEIDRFFTDMPDHRQAVIIDKAFKYDRLMADRKALAAKKTVAVAPKVQKPRAAQDTKSQDSSRIAALGKHLGDSRNVNDIDALTELAQRTVRAK